MKKSWIKEIARDIIALGGIPFFILVLIRVSILKDPIFLAQFALAGILFLILALAFKSNMYSGLALIVGVFTSLNYNDLKYAIFVTLAYVLLLFSLIYLKEDKKKTFLGVLFGAISTIISYFSVNLIFT